MKESLWERIKRFLSSLLEPLKNERGEIQVGDPEPEPVPDPEPELDPEELDPELEPEPKPGDPAEPDPALIDPEPEPEPDPVPYARFKEVHTKSKRVDEAENKLDQFKRLGAEGYYQLYPDEKPEGEPEEDTPGKPVLSMHEMENHRITGGEFDGMTLGELYEEKPLAAIDIYNDYKDEQSSKRQSDAQRREESDREIKSFTSARAKEAFGKDVDGLTDDQVAQVEELVGAVTKWMVETGRGGGIIEDGFYLMNKENLFEKAQTETLKDIVAMLKEPGTPSISTVKTTPTAGGYGRFLNMTPEQAAAEMDKLPDEDQVEFLKKAPAEVRKKFPALPWEDA